MAKEGPAEMLREKLLPSGSRVTQLVICQTLILSTKPSCTWLSQPLAVIGALSKSQGLF